MRQRNINRLDKEAHEVLKKLVTLYVFDSNSKKDISKETLYFKYRQEWILFCKKISNKSNGLLKPSTDAFEKIIKLNYVKYTKAMFPKKFNFFLRFKKHTF